MMRLFVAIDFPKETKKELVDLVKLLIGEGYPLSFEKEENFHLTLKFLGWVNEKVKGQASKLDQINEAIRRATIEIKPFWFKPTEIGYFLKESLIMWVGAEAQEGLFKLVEQLENELANLGFAKEKREFAPHITLARKRQATPRGQWKKIAEELKEKFNPPTGRLNFNKFKVAEITLMQSTLTPKGSIYSPVKTLLLNI